MAWCEDNGVDYIFGLVGNAVLHALADETAAAVRARHAQTDADKVRGFASFDYAAGSWDRLRRVVARLEATARGFDARYIVTSLTTTRGGPPMSSKQPNQRLSELGQVQRCRPMEVGPAVFVGRSRR